MFNNRKMNQDQIIIVKIIRLVEGNLEEMADGFHISDLALSKANQMILNLVCNDNMNFNDGSCCKSSDHRTSLQTITFSILAGAVGLSVIIIIYQLVTRRHVSNRSTHLDAMLAHGGNQKYTDCRLFYIFYLNCCNELVIWFIHFRNFGLNSLNIIEICQFVNNCKLQNPELRGRMKTIIIQHVYGLHFKTLFGFSENIILSA